MFSHVIGFPSFLRLTNVPLYIWHIFFVHSTVDRHLLCFYILAIVHNAAVKIGVQIPLWINTPKWDWWIIVWYFYFSFFEELPYCFTFPPPVHKSSKLSTYSLTLIFGCFFDNSHPNRCEVISHCGCDLCFSDGWWHLFIHLLAICISSLEKTLFKSFAHF